MSAPLWTVAVTVVALAAPAPSVTADRARATTGDRVLVRLAGWPPGTVTVEVCGARCAVDTAVQTYVPRSGTAGVPLTVAAPPGGCPCTVRATSLDRATTAATPLDVTSATPPAVVPPVGGVLAVVEASLDGGRSWRARLGWPAPRTLVLRLRNDTAVAAPVALSLAAGRGAHPTGFVAAPDVPDLAPGEERTVSVPVDLPAPAVGTHTVAAEVTSAGRTVHIAATAASYPWAVPGVLALAVAALARSAWRHRRRSA